ncbi:unnamed protein product [Bemisia tabaci]|uniref:tRNA-dihydrouridine(16/17) synthase [NAD(P)(+)]-like n=1 Tax=Bemisia tabaci TaxID=7038 RepID=A0A9P0EYF2_BEMTA|nr:unnamed protein product [Bemisia tabaci]
MSNVWESLGHPKFILAPMVDASELAWRLFSKKHGAQLCYTPMFHSSNFARDKVYRKENFQTCSEDRPLIVQFCANDAETLLKAARIVEPHCDAIDINLGCPQSIAKRGHYGAFLQDEWDLLTKMVKTLRDNLRIPITCKIRVFENIDHTIKYAQMLEAAGCQMLTVHGRTREQKGPLTGVASWDHIKAVRENVSIPVIANGNIQCLQDIKRCLEHTGCVGVMSAEGNLYNPGVFEGLNPPVWEAAAEYLDFVLLHPCPTSYTRGHLFKILQTLFSLPETFDLRAGIAKGQSVEDFIKVIAKIKEQFAPIHAGKVPYNLEQPDYNLRLPPWLCQPHVRISPEDHLKKMEECRLRDTKNEKENINECCKREGSPLSKKKMKRLKRIGKINFNPRRTFEKCSKCSNPAGTKCEQKLCKVCCRTKCYNENLDCEGHRILIKTKRERSKKNDLTGKATKGNGDLKHSVSSVSEE